MIGPEPPAPPLTDEPPLPVWITPLPPVPESIPPPVLQPPQATTAATPAAASTPHRTDDVIATPVSVRTPAMAGQQSTLRQRFARSVHDEQRRRHRRQLVLEHAVLHVDRRGLRLDVGAARVQREDLRLG